MGVIRDLAKSYKEHDCFSLATNIAFFAFLSVIPILMITTSLAGFVLGSSENLVNQIVSALTTVLPKGQDELAANLNNIIARRSGIGGAGVIFLLFVASLLFSSIEHAFDKIFQSVKKRNFLHSKILSILVVFGAIFILFLPAIINLFQTALASFNISIPLRNIAANHAFLVGLLIGSFIAAIKIIPNHDVKLGYAVSGGVFFAAGIEVAKFIFKWYVAGSFDWYNVVYGSLTMLVIIILWIYYLANVLLISAELVAVLQRRYSICRNHAASGSRA